MPVESSMLALGSSLPNATLPDTEGKDLNFIEYANGRPLLLMVVCNHCPYVKHIEEEIGKVANSALDQGIATIAICSNDVTTHPSDDVVGMREQATRANWRFPYLVDESQSVARELQAVCTPDFFLFDKDGHLAYRGAFDGSSPGNDTAVTGDLLREALTAVSNGQSVPEPHKPSLGCSIKWKAA